ncbi:hypothetical protein [Ferruginibacter profundus]
MALLSIQSRQISISKYLIYFILMGVLLKPMGTKLWYAITYTKTKGAVKYFTFNKPYRNTYYYPVVAFVVNQDTLTCTGSSLQHDAINVHDSVSVIYGPGDSPKAYVYTFLGFWAPPLTYIAPAALVLTLIFLGVTTIPQNFVIKL